MGAWGSGHFENDDALDYLAELDESGDEESIRMRLNAVVENAQAYRESPDCCEALVAAELIAAHFGNASPDLPEEAAKWLKGRSFTSDDVALALRALKGVAEDSELLELWTEVDSRDEWMTKVNDLKGRLS